MLRAGSKNMMNGSHAVAFFDPLKCGKGTTLFC
jgi:hypothetical protein